MFNTYAKSLIAQGDLERAEGALRDSLRLEPRLMEAQTNLAQLVWLRTGDAAQATASLDQALASFSRDEALLAAKAAILQGTGDPRAAHACLSAAMEGRQASPMLLVRAGLAALEFDPAAALALAERALAVMPANMAARTVLAAAQLGIGDARAALPCCQGLLATSPDDQYLIARLDCLAPAGRCTPRTAVRLQKSGDAAAAGGTGALERHGELSHRPASEPQSTA